MIPFENFWPGRGLKGDSVLKSNRSLVLLFLVLVAGWGYCVAPAPHWGKFDTLRIQELRLGQSEAKGMLRCRVLDGEAQIQLAMGQGEVQLFAQPTQSETTLLLKHTASSRTIEFSTEGSSALFALLVDRVGRAQLAYRADSAFLMVGESDNSQIIVLREEKDNPHIAFVEKTQ
jgi:hypothetical protein